MNTQVIIPESFEMVGDPQQPLALQLVGKVDGVTTSCLIPFPREVLRTLLETYTNQPMAVNIEGLSETTYSAETQTGVHKKRRPPDQTWRKYAHLPMEIRIALEFNKVSEEEVRRHFPHLKF